MSLKASNMDIFHFRILKLLTERVATKFEVEKIRYIGGTSISMSHERSIENKPGDRMVN